MKSHIRSVFAVLLATALLLSAFTACKKEKPAATVSTPSSAPVSEPSAPATQDQPQQPDAVESTVSQAEESEPQEQPESNSAPNSTTVSGTPFSAPKYNTNLDIEDNVFMDSLLYTGYNMKKHRADGNMWIYILSGDKRGLGYLSNIGYGGGSSGLETTAEGLPDIKFFEQYGLVCASFATYVYFNYLPNVAGIDTSMLTRPERTYNAHSFYTAALDWIDKGLARSIGFTATRAGGYIQFSPDEEIPIGSIMVFEDDRLHDGRGSHIVVYGGYKNGNHWVYQVGTDNGPEMCAVERMLFGPDPQWPIMVITPTTLRLSASIQVTVKDQNGSPIPSVALSAKNLKTGNTVTLGTTNASGTVAKDGLNYGDYEITQTLPAGYTASAQKVTLGPQNNSQNTLTITASGTVGTNTEP